jgi:hypothetical protein
VLLIRALYPATPAQAAEEVVMPHPATTRS